MTEDDEFTVDEDKPLREQVDNDVPDDVELFERSGKIWGRDDHGEFRIRPMGGADHIVEGRCGRPLKFYQERYGQVRYCTGMPESTFVADGSDFCKHHKSREALMERAYELFEHGYFATNYVNFAEKLDPVKFMFAVEMMGGLLKMSTYDFETNTETRTVNTENVDLIEEDAVEVELPIPSNEKFSLQANELWTAALKEVMTQNMQEVVFEDGVAAEKLAASTDMEGHITDTIYEEREHHLHLPLSRLSGDITDHLENGGVAIDDDESGSVTFQKNDYTLDVQPTETDSADAEDASDVQQNFAEHMQADDDEVAVEIE